ncbi:hypothetical protein L6452_19076 [Arctium lappa]|uniref:Uncharacterized protein n=1 Tax=Arctium lappa TaxID=4217 RepID=A0ACB9B6X6_ARCLA|nr:hypothetical protein L6452_19076 [Arctium lappa]
MTETWTTMIVAWLKDNNDIELDRRENMMCNKKQSSLPPVVAVVQGDDYRRLNRDQKISEYKPVSAGDGFRCGLWNKKKACNRVMEDVPRGHVADHKAYRPTDDQATIERGRAAV